MLKIKVQLVTTETDMKISFLYIVLGSTGSKPKSASHTTSHMQYTQFVFKTNASVSMLAAYIEG